jgi:hypothetical protein
MSLGKVRRRTWIHEGKERGAWGFTLTTAEGRQEVRLPHEGRGAGGTVLFGGRED